MVSSEILSLGFYATDFHASMAKLFFEVLKFAVSKSKAVSTVLISSDINALTKYGRIYDRNA